MGELLSFLCAFSWAVSNMFVQKGLKQATPKDHGAFMTTVVNFAIYGSIILFMYFSGSLFFNWHVIGIFALAGFFTTFLGRNSFYAGIRRIGTSRAVVIKNTSPLFSVIGGVIFLKENFNFQLGLGLLFLLAGIFILGREAYIYRQLPENAEQPQAQGVIQTVNETEKPVTAFRIPSFGGLFLALLSALAFGFGHVVRKYGLSLLANAFLGAFVGSTIALISLGINLGISGSLKTVVTDNFKKINFMYVLGGLTATLGQSFMFFALIFAPVSRVSVIMASENFFALLIGYLFLKQEELLNSSSVAAAICIFCGAVLAVLA